MKKLSFNPPVKSDEMTDGNSADETRKKIKTGNLI